MYALPVAFKQQEARLVLMLVVASVMTDAACTVLTGRLLVVLPAWKQ